MVESLRKKFGKHLRDTRGASDLSSILLKVKSTENVKRDIEPFLVRQMADIERERDAIVNANTPEKQRLLGYKLHGKDQNGNSVAVSVLPNNVRNPIDFRLKLLGFRA